MGLAGELKSKILGTYAPHCYHVGTITFPNAVRIDDTLISLYHRIGSLGDNTFTSDEAYRAFIVPIDAALRLDEYMYAVVCDNQQGVPWQKRLTQDERRAANSSYALTLEKEYPNYVKYPNECEFVDGGIVRPAASGIAEDAVTERMLLDEVIKNSRLRLKLMHYFCSRLAELPIPPNRVLRFDYDHAGPWYFTADTAPMQNCDRGTDLGEYDITANFIACEYVDYPIIFQTTDTDTIPLVSSLVSSGRFKHEVAWIFAPGGYVDCHRMVRDTLDATGMSIRTFILACVLCGTDFYKKTWLTHWFNDDAIFSALAHPHCQAAFVGFENHAIDDYSAILNFVMWCHTARLDPVAIAALKEAGPRSAPKKKAPLSQPTFDNEPEDESMAASSSSSSSSAPSKKRRADITSWQAKGSSTVEYLRHRATPMDRLDVTPSLGKRYRLPSMVDLVNAQSRVQFNLWYWTKHWMSPKQTFEQYRALNIDNGSRTSASSSSSRDDQIDDLSEQRLIDITLKGMTGSARINWGAAASSSSSINRISAYFSPDA